MLSCFIFSISCLFWLGIPYSSVSPVSSFASCHFLLVDTQVHFVFFPCFSCRRYLLLSLPSLAFPSFISAPLLLQRQEGSSLETSDSSWAVGWPASVFRCWLWRESKLAMVLETHEHFTFNTALTPSTGTAVRTHYCQVSLSSHASEQLSHLIHVKLK